MNINNRWKECEDKHINDPVVELIYESISLMDENIKLFVENKRLKERIEVLERCNGCRLCHGGFSFGTATIV